MFWQRCHTRLSRLSYSQARVHFQNQIYANVNPLSGTCVCQLEAATLLLFGSTALTNINYSLFVTGGTILRGYVRPWKEMRPRQVRYLYGASRTFVDLPTLKEKENKNRTKNKFYVAGLTMYISVATAIATYLHTYQSRQCKKARPFGQVQIQIYTCVGACEKREKRKKTSKIEYNAHARACLYVLRMDGCIYV